MLTLMHTTAVTDEAQDRMIVTMGYFYNHRKGVPSWLKDTWSFSLTTHTWTLLNSGENEPVPRARYGQSVVKYGRSLYMYGGTGDDRNRRGTVLSEARELWRYDLDGNAWTLIHETSDDAAFPIPRSLHTAALIGGNKMLMFAGFIQHTEFNHRDDTWLLDLDTHQWTEVLTTGPSPAERFGACMAGLGDRVYMYGGMSRVTHSILSDFWVFTLGQGWEQIVPKQESATLPTARNYHGMAAVRYSLDGSAPRTYMAIFAGANCTGSCFCKSDTWLYDIESGLWFPVAVPEEPATRYHHSLVEHGGRLYAFGGESYKPVYKYHNGVIQLTLGSPSAGGGSVTVWAILLISAGAVAVFVAVRRRKGVPDGRFLQKRA